MDFRPVMGAMCTCAHFGKVAQRVLAQSTSGMRIRELKGKVKCRLKHSIFPRAWHDRLTGCWTLKDSPSPALGLTFIDGAFSIPRSGPWPMPGGRGGDSGISSPCWSLVKCESKWSHNYSTAYLAAYLTSQLFYRLTIQLSIHLTQQITQQSNQQMG